MSFTYIAIKITHTDFILGLYGTPQFICLKQAPLSRFLSANFLFIGCLSQTKDLNGRWMGLQIGRPLIYDIIQGIGWKKFWNRALRDGQDPTCDCKTTRHSVGYCWEQQLIYMARGRGTKSRDAELAIASSCEHNNRNHHFLPNARSLANNMGELPS